MASLYYFLAVYFYYYESFKPMTCTFVVCWCSGHGQHGFLLLELVQMRPHSILVFSRVEQAHISVFSALLSVLDQGTLCDLEGHTVDFGHTVVIFASDMGNSKVLAQLVGHAYNSPIEVMQQVNYLLQKKVMFLYLARPGYHFVL